LKHASRFVRPANHFHVDVGAAHGIFGTTSSFPFQSDEERVAGIGNLSAPVSARDELSKVLSELKGEAVRVSLEGGELYDLELSLSSATSKEGTFDTTVIWAIKTSQPDAIETGAAMKLNMDEVVKVEVLRNARCVFERPAE